MFRCSLAIALLMLAAGCGGNPNNLPSYRWTDEPTALHDLCARSSAVRSVQAESTLVLTRSDGQSVRLDGAVVMRLPASVRMRAWKFGQAVFDLTVTPDGVWIEGPQDASRRDQVLPASVSAAKMARAWSILSGEFFCRPTARIVETGRSRFQVEDVMDEQRIVCDVDRATLTPRRYAVFDSNGVQRFELTLNRYEIVNGIPWPVHLTANSENGIIEIQLKDVELNGELMPNAFVPPKKAQKLP